MHILQNGKAYDVALIEYHPFIHNIYPLKANDGGIQLYFNLKNAQQLISVLSDST
jgi:hypothetical protein